MTKFTFKGKEIVEKGPKGETVSKHSVFSLEGQPHKGQWMLTKIDSAMRDLAGTFVENIYHSENIVIDIFSEPGEELEEVRTKAIRIEDYSSEPHKVVIVFPHQEVPDATLIKALDSKEH
jgi:hypothetical protein